MGTTLLELYPDAGVPRPLPGTYLAQRLDECGTAEQTFVYANFVCSLDGRIAVREPGAAGYTLAPLGSGNDWRLFQELQAQAPCLVTHAGYLRQLAAGEFPDILQIGLADEARDLAEWRRQHGLAPQPAIAVVSSNLDLELPPSLATHGQAVHLLTTAQAPPARIRAFEAAGHTVTVTGAGPLVEGAALVRTLREAGFDRLCLMAGPRLLHTALGDGVLSRLYVTITHQVLAGEDFHTFAAGPLLGAAGRLRLHSLYYDADLPKGAGQWFAAFDVRAALDAS